MTSLLLLASTIWIPPIADDNTMTEALARAVELHAPRTHEWQLGESRPGGEPVVIRIKRAKDRYEVRLDETVVVVTTTPKSAVPTVAHALLLKAQFLVHQQVPEVPSVPAPAAEIAPPEPPKFALGLATTTTVGLNDESRTDYWTMGAGLYGSMRLVEPIWLTVEGVGYLWGVGEVDVAGGEAHYRVRAFPISVLTGGLWSRRRWSWGASGGVVFIPVRVVLDNGDTQTDQVWGAAARGLLAYQIVGDWHVTAALDFIYHADEKDVGAASSGNLYVLPKPLGTMSFGLERRF